MSKNLCVVDTPSRLPKTERLKNKNALTIDSQRLTHFIISKTLLQ